MSPHRNPRPTLFWLWYIGAGVALSLALTQAASAAPKPLAGLTILLDPGHGGADPGAIGPTGLKESTANLRVATYLRMLLLADGATVHMTREGDQFLSLSDRVAIAKSLNPDLFVSIHHNASLRKNVQNRAEIFYNALDRGVSWLVGQAMAEAFVPRRGDGETLLIPGGFYVLRNNPAPAVLTEAGYLSVKAIERELKSAKGLTNEAQTLRMAIRKAFKNPLIEAEVFATRPSYVNTPFARFILTSNQPIDRAQIRLDPPQNVDFAFERLPFGGTVYTLYNTQPLPSGNYTLSMLFFNRQSVSRQIRLPITLELPLKDSVLLPILPSIPRGMSGDFPLTLVLKDSLGRVNPRIVRFTVQWNGLSIPGITRADGKAVIHLPLTGKEDGPQEVVAVTAEGEEIARTTIAVAAPRGNVVLGQLLCGATHAGLEKARVLVAGRHTIQTTVGGYFAYEFPAIFRNLAVKLQPPAGYPEVERWIRSAGEPLTRARFVVEPIAPGLLGKHIGIMAARAHDPWVRPLVKALMKVGARTTRLSFPEDQDKPEYTAVLQANTLGNLDLVLSFRPDPGPTLTMRHYHRGGAGKALALAVQKALASGPTPLALRVEAGSDYELGNLGATCVVVGLPALPPPHTPERLAEALRTALQQSN